MSRNSQFKQEANVCPSCLGTDLSVFYKVENVPVHSVVLLRSKQEAIDFPQGDIALGYCKLCGFVTNLVFDSTQQDYSHEYEATQAYSATFNHFNHQLANNLIARYQLLGKRIIEIGCGQGEFLSMLCKIGKNSGIGFDPAYEPERQIEPLAERVQIISDYYTEKYASHQVDFICCKMTLEHIHPTLDFVSMIRRSIGEQLEAVVFFQVPNASYVFGDLAFWDVYYEHCSYFNERSITGLFQRSGFEVLDLWNEYDDQYLMIEAKPVENTNANKIIQYNGLVEMGAEIEQFARLVPQKKELWVERLQQYRANHQKIVLWGGGSKAVAFLTSLNLPQELVEYAVDINPNKTGTFLPGSGQEIVAPQQLKDIKPDVVIVMNPIYQDEILAQLHELNIHPNVHSVEDI